MLFYARNFALAKNGGGIITKLKKISRNAQYGTAEDRSVKHGPYLPPSPSDALYLAAPFGHRNLIKAAPRPFQLPVLFRRFTHSLSRYSIWLFNERKSSSAQATNSFQSVADNLSGICFFSFSSNCRPTLFLFAAA